MTGFRLSLGGAQEALGVNADIVTYGKVIGGGLPVGAFASSNEIMKKLAPEGPVYQAGTLSGNPLAMSAGFTTIKSLTEDLSIYNRLEEKTKFLHEEMEKCLKKRKISYQINRFGSMISLHFTDSKVYDFKSSTKGDNIFFKKYFHGMLSEGIYLPPSAFESYFLNDALTFEDINYTINAFDKVLKSL